MRKAGFAKGLQTGCQEVEKELADLWGGVKQPEEKLHKEGNWHVAKVTQARTGDNNVCEQRDEARPIWNITPAACRVVKSLAPALIPQLIHSMNTQEVNRGTNSCRSNPWDSISQ